jgi:limonene 1,2-monooxygenase
MLGIEPTTQRPRMDEALGAIVRLLHGETVTMKTDWFELREARLQLLPFTKPCFPIAVASMFSPAGMIAAGKYGLGVLSIGAGMPGGGFDIRDQWAAAEQAAAKAGTTIRREEWRILRSFHLAETREQAFSEAEEGERRETTRYFEGTLGRPPGPVTLEEQVKLGAAIVGTPDDAIAAIERLQEQSGGFGGVLARAHEWASREATLRSFELLARYVVPRFQGVVAPIEASNEWVRSHRTTIFSPTQDAIAKAFKDAGRELPLDLAQRGAR